MTDGILIENDALEMESENTASDDRSELSEEELRKGAEKFEFFWLRPLRYKGEEATIRFCIRGEFSGWKLKDELVESLGLTVGDTVNVEGSVEFGPGLIGDDDRVDIFAEGDAATWLLQTAVDAGGSDGCTFDAVVRFSYVEAPVGGIEGKMVAKASLILERGIRRVNSEGRRPKTKNRITLMSDIISSLA
ncbi:MULTISPECIES: hypothetical protein [Collinsella]|uniref:Uncharacterized protein n=1 Tax=Collinsella ihumii TaxID=1720204 RepID=A0AAW7JY14_9ACTN|nr:MULTISPECIES: hypothetical protein [Collinsella]MDN0069410.1 hypothetical protein [Collinsella ihumii]